MTRGIAFELLFVSILQQCPRGEYSADCTGAEAISYDYWWQTNGLKSKVDTICCAGDSIGSTDTATQWTAK
ncbi:hypothetical protein V1477_013161 [Vespula maculifrons]|uniref:Uncharacterized protein n=2 Tax=Vespula TaxID=7451 RepID=A0A834N2B6_VESVU|nr:hypothetical protein HZH66_009063 [Vespula vulgaris]